MVTYRWNLSVEAKILPNVESYSTIVLKSKARAFWRYSSFLSRPRITQDRMETSDKFHRVLSCRVSTVGDVKNEQCGGIIIEGDILTDHANPQVFHLEFKF